MPTRIEFFVPGAPAPGGSKSPYLNKNTGRINLAPASKKTKDWRAVVRLAAEAAYDGPLLTGPISLSIIFVMPRPKNHYGTGRNAGMLKASAPYWHTKTPDRTKLIRSTEDALKHVIWNDDSQVCAGRVQKVYGDKPGARIVIQDLRPREE